MEWLEICCNCLKFLWKNKLRFLKNCGKVYVYSHNWEEREMAICHIPLLRSVWRKQIHLTKVMEKK